MSLVLENIKQKTYFSRHLEIDFFTLDMLHIQKRKRNNKKQEKLAGATFIFKHNIEDLDSEFWRTVDVTKLGATICISNV